MKIVTGDTAASRNGQRRVVITLAVFGAGAGLLAAGFNAAVAHELEAVRFVVVAASAIWSIGGFFAGATLAEWWHLRRYPKRTWPFEDEPPHT